MDTIPGKDSAILKIMRTFNMDKRRCQKKEMKAFSILEDKLLDNNTPLKGYRAQQTNLFLLLTQMNYTAASEMCKKETTNKHIIHFILLRYWSSNSN